MDKSYEIKIQPASRITLLNWKELSGYRDLLLLIIRRDFVARYQQTILGPAWAIVQPLATSLVFTVIFGKVAKIPTDGAPPFLFYLTGMLFWQLFSGSVLAGGNSLQNNASLFNKVYFPRIIPSLGTQISQLIPFTIQLLIYAGFGIWYFTGSETAVFHWQRLLWFPFLLILVITLSLGISLGFSAITAKYRDLQHALGFLVQLGLYATPVIYPVSSIAEQWRWMVWLNPMAAPISTAKWMLLDAGSAPGIPLIFSTVATGIILVIALYFFQRVQRTFIDTV
ncbi:ABC transporter permease [Cerasicoccus arenae]|uniref:Transport permease protein n=1 Tax=Cerasicoccus arenae TaxID=424488 RepID=A0A8J3D8I6_9BACT|nr:ABC transporter permease [Cerasicoccus arenae]MBK1857500.1 ABC transporter permease [Cerasicoccus arenae]GHB95378.1 transport permease protein [Cerasicoccus arenae]